MKKIIVLLLIISTCSLVGNSQNLTQHSRLEAFDLEADDNLGFSCGISGDYAIGGAWHEDHDSSGTNPMSNAGAAYIYHYNSSTDKWETEAKLVAADRSAGNVFGTSVDIYSGTNATYAVVGSVEENAARGAAYVFERNSSGGWAQVAKLVASSRQSSDRFGYSVAIYDTTIIVGAYHEDEDEIDSNTLMNAGSAYIFTRTGGAWGFKQKIVASDRSAQDYFGYSVGIHENNLIVGAYRYDPVVSTLETGGAYVYTYTGGSWSQTKILTADTTYDGDRYGWSVDVHHPYYVVGAPYHDYDNSGVPVGNAGAAYIYDASNSWAETKVFEGDRFGQDNLGIDVAIYDTILIAGAVGNNYALNGAPPLFSDAGAAYVYKKGSAGMWPQSQKLITDNRATEDKMGISVAVFGETFLCGASEDNQTSPTPIPSPGAVYVFKDAASTGVSSTRLNTSVKVFPNPSPGKFTVELGEFFSEIGLSVQSILGETVIEKKFSNTNVLDFEIISSPGIYFLTIKTMDGKRLIERVLKR